MGYVIQSPVSGYTLPLPDFRGKANGKEKGYVSLCALCVVTTIDIL